MAQLQVSAMLAELNSGVVTISNIRLAGARVAEVLFFPDGTTSAVGAELATRHAEGAVALDWEQRWDGSGPSTASSRVYSVQAALPAELPWQSVSSVAAMCRSCQLPSSTGAAFTGVLAAAEMQAGSGAGSSAATVVFVFEGTLQLPSGSGSNTHGAEQSRRRLSQAPQSAPLADCTLSVPGADPLPAFQGCYSVPTFPATLYEVYYTLESTASGGTRWRGGLRVNTTALGAKWAGFGFPRFPGSMIGANAVIVKECEGATCPTQATVTGYLLEGYSSSDNVAGSFVLTDTAAAKADDGTLVAVFTAERPQALSTLTASPYNFIFACGPLDASGAVQSHFAGTFPYGSNTIPLRVASAGGAPPDPAPAAPAPATAPAAVAPAPAPEVASAAAACELTVDGSQLTFAACIPVPGIGTDFNVLWNLEPSNGPTTELTLGVSAAADGWVAVGFPTSPGRMIGATAVVLKTSPSSGTGAEIGDYYLADKTSSGVQPPGRLNVSGASASADGGVMQGTIKVQLDTAAAANPSFSIILAAGPLDSNGGLEQHSNRGDTTVNLASGAGGSVSGEPASARNMKNAHAWLMAVGWGVLIPLGIVTARHAKRWDPLWFHVHRAVQVTGLACALAGFIIIFFAVKEASGTSTSSYGLHRRLGISAMSLGLFQLTALVFRPHKGTKLRPYWELVHHWVGRAAALVAVANIYEGMLNVKNVGTWAVVTYSVIFGLIASIHLGLDALRLARWLTRDKQAPDAEQGAGAGTGVASGSEVGEAKDSRNGKGSQSDESVQNPSTSV